MLLLLLLSSRTFPLLVWILTIACCRRPSSWLIYTMAHVLGRTRLKILEAEAFCFPDGEGLGSRSKCFHPLHLGLSRSQPENYCAEAVEGFCNVLIGLLSETRHFLIF